MVQETNKHNHPLILKTFSNRAFGQTFCYLASRNKNKFELSDLKSRWNRVAVDSYILGCST